jgi:hypothetical protein
MSTLGYTSGQIEHKEQVLDELNRAALALQADALQLRTAMHVDNAVIEWSRRIVDAFAQRVEDGLAGRVTDAVVHAVIVNVDTSSRPREDWANDLHELRSAIAHRQPVSSAQLRVLLDLIRYIDRAFTDDLHRLFGRS